MKHEFALWLLFLKCARRSRHMKDCRRELRTSDLFSEQCLLPVNLQSFGVIFQRRFAHNCTGEMVF